MRVPVVLEVAPKRSFASALDWPGWSRGGKTPDDALEALVAYGPRYAAVAKRARVPFTAPADVARLDVIERLSGGTGTEFGVPSSPAATEGNDPSPRDLERLIGLLDAAWRAFDASAKRAEGTTLRLGPRGGGRQVPKIIGHVGEAEAAYLHQLGSKPPRGDMRAVRRAFTTALRARVAGEDLPDPNKVRTPWSVRYAIRRSAWHALDHAWEIEDRSGGD